MTWLEFIVNSRADMAETIEDFLLSQGAHAVTIENIDSQAIFEPELGSTPHWDNNRITALFDDGLQAEILFDALQKHFGKTAPESFQVQALEDRPWEREWLKHFQSMRFADKLWIIPVNTEKGDSDYPADLKDSDCIVRMDPGLAFGTGTHETTALCLEWLAGASLTGKRVVDYGCGSGILAIAAHCLGAKAVYACDIDPQAILATEENARRNHIEQGLGCYTVDHFRQLFEQQEEPVDILIANILAGPLATLADEFAALLKTGGQIVLSGILKEQADAVICSYQNAFDNFDITDKNDWVRLSATRK